MNRSSAGAVLLLSIGVAGAVVGGSPTFAQQAPAAPREVGPKEALEALISRGASTSAEERARLLPASLAASLELGGDEEIERWRTELLRSLRGARVGEVRRHGDVAVVRFETSGGREEREWPMALRSGAWVVATPVHYGVRGPALDRARGRGPATLTLKARSRDTSDYGGSCAFSFTHGTHDAESVKNRVCIWYGACGHLHVKGGAARVRGESLDDVKGIPVGVRWSETLVPEVGGVYVIHTRRKGHRDFHVKAVAREVSEGAVRLEWTLLTEGPGSPPNLHRPTPPEKSADGADGCDGHCSEGPRPVPDPEPDPEGTPTGGK